MSDAGCPSLLGLASEDGHVRTLWLLLYSGLVSVFLAGGLGPSGCHGFPNYSLCTTPPKVPLID